MRDPPGPSESPLLAICDRCNRADHFVVLRACHAQGTRAEHLVSVPQTCEKPFISWRRPEMNSSGSTPHYSQPTTPTTMPPPSVKTSKNRRRDCRRSHGCPTRHSWPPPPHASSLSSSLPSAYPDGSGSLALAAHHWPWLGRRQRRALQRTTPLAAASRASTPHSNALRCGSS